MKSEKKIKVEGKGDLDYYEFSNNQGKDLVGLLELNNKLIEACLKEKLPLFSVIVTKGKVCTVAYKTEWDNKERDKLRNLIEGIIENLASFFGIIVEVKGIDPTKIKKII